MAAPDPLLKEWKQLGFSQVFTNWLRSLSGTQDDVDDVADNITIINNSITNINTDVSGLEDQIADIPGQASPSFVEPYANTQAPGVIEIATQTEVDAGTDTKRAVTPATLAAWSGFGDLPSWVPLTDGAEPPSLISDGAGGLIFVSYTP